MIDKGSLDKLNQIPGLNVLQRWVQLASKPAIATFVMSAVSLAANVLVFRVVPPAQAGQFVLLVAISQFLSLLSELGQPHLIRRRYIQQQLGYFDWPHDLAGTVFIIAPLALVSSSVAAYAYNFEASYTIVIFFIILSHATVNTCSHILASQQHYLSSNIILRIPNNLLLAVGLLLLCLPEPERFSYLLVAYPGLSLTTMCLSIVIVHRQVRRGTGRIQWAERKQGLAFVISNLSYQLPEEGLLSLAGLFVNTGQIAAVAALSLFLRPFGTLCDILNHILLTELARHEHIRYKQMLWALFALTGFMTLGAVTLFPFTSHWLYAGRYDIFHYLIPLLAVGAALQLIEVLPRSHVIACSNNQTVNRFVAFSTVGALLVTGLALGLILQMGVVGLALGIGGLYGLRAVISFLFSKRLLALQRSLPPTSIQSCET